MSVGSDPRHGDDSEGRLLQPGQLIRPVLSDVTAIQLVEKLYGFNVTSIESLPSYDDRNFRVTVSSQHSNPHVTQLWKHGFVFKVLNSLDSQKKHVDAEHEMMRILGRNELSCSQPIPNIYGLDKSLETLNTQLAGSSSSTSSVTSQHIVRLLTFVPGQRLVTVSYTTGLLVHAGQYLASMHNALQNLRHAEALAQHQTIWSLSSVPLLRQYAYAITDATNRQLVNDVISAFELHVVPNIPLFVKGVIHGDFNEQKVLVEREDHHEATCSTASTHDDPAAAAAARHPVFRVAGIIDFGDATCAPYVFDVAIAIMYLMLDSRDVARVEVGGHVLAGYLSTGRQMAQVECNALRLCVAARYAQSLTMGAYSHSLDPDNDYLLVTARRGWSQLHQFWHLPQQQLHLSWKTILSSYHLKCHF